MNWYIRAATVAAIGTIAASCGGGGGSITGGGGGGGGTDTPCAANTICMRFSSSSYGSGTGSFSPSSLTVATGTVVTFTNGSGVTHNVVFDSKSPPGGDIGSISSGSQSRTFSAAGSYPFHCTLHEGMIGTITAQ